MKDNKRWGGECYDSTCPFHTKDEPICGADSFYITDEEFEEEANCRKERINENNQRA